MDVSNSTGQDTSYRVLGGGSAPKPSKGGRAKEKDKDKAPKGGAEPQPLHAGTLEPNTYVTLQLPEASACVVQFHREGKLIAQQEVKDGRCEELLVALVPSGRGAPKPYVCRRKA
jgi:hypothetical protein